jgi:hypothetical protein
VDAPNLIFACKLPAKMPELSYAFATKRKREHIKLDVIDSQLVLNRLQIHGLVYMMLVKIVLQFMCPIHKVSALAMGSFTACQASLQTSFLRKIQ